ncbi:toll/interleukin-1 receptor domain-containing protein [Vibrio litoralis]|uniref:toll/interleukin-1 receptor domain-containing protein n=1 Tax=Vibrio litoralis TaxID=335972 RepID=UPI0004100876|nr:toll/interleukin-1 receptor domain-containing protein [Vibrio litoralis]
MSSTPTVFISYSHDSVEHKQWSLNLAIRLMHSGIDTIIDAWSLEPGDDLPHFMETSLNRSDRIIMVCTDNYVAKANKGSGGVGYEKMIVTSSLMTNIDNNKVIPIIRQKGSSDVPTFLKSKLYIDFSNDDEYEAVIDDLIRAIHGEPLFKKPDLGSNPFLPVENKLAEKNNDFKEKVLFTIIWFYEKNYTGLTIDTLCSHMGASKILIEFQLEELVEDGFIDIIAEMFINLQKKAKLFAIQKGWVG